MTKAVIGKHPTEQNGSLDKSYFSEFKAMTVREFLSHIARKAGVLECSRCHEYFATEQALKKHTDTVHCVNFV